MACLKMRWCRGALLVQFHGNLATHERIVLDQGDVYSIGSVR
jgi:hypothetical protein